MDSTIQSDSPLASWINWADIPLIMAVARAGSLLQAAALLGISQPTLSRRLEACEQKTGTTLFIRSASGMRPTASGRELLKFAETANRALLAAQAACVHSGSGLSGTVRVTASEWLGQLVFPSMMAALSVAHPGVRIELLAEPGWTNLPAGEADIAIRASRFEQSTIHQSLVGVVGFGLYASPSYLAEHGVPTQTASLARHRILQMIAPAKAPVADAVWLKRVAAGAQFVAGCNSRVALAECALAHQGIACLPHLLGKRMLGLRLIQLEETPPDRKLWLGSSRTARRFPHVTTVRDFLSRRLRELASEFAG